VAQGLSLEFKSHSTKKKKEINKERKEERKKNQAKGKGKIQVACWLDETSNKT
jgi:hypothetical protein